jgi:hypothetical protein
VYSRLVDGSSGLIYCIMTLVPKRVSSPQVVYSLYTVAANNKEFIRIVQEVER